MNLLLAAFCLASPPGRAAPGEGETAVSMIEITGAFLVGAVDDVESPQVSFPPPRRYRGQVPLSFNISVKPEKTRISVRTVPSARNDRVLESTLVTPGWRCMEMPIVSIASVDHEDRGEGRNNVAPGVPYLTLNETPKGVVTWGILRKDGCDREAKKRGEAILQAGAWEAQGARLNAWTKATYRAWTDLPSEIALPKKG